MKLKPTPQQAFLIMSMLFGESPAQREPSYGKAPLKLKPRDRAELVRAGLVRVEKRGRTSHLVLDDGGWSFLEQYPEATLPSTKLAGPLLQSVLAKLRRHLESCASDLAEFVNVAPPVEAEESQSPESVAPHDAGLATSEETIRKACLALTNGATRQRVRLKDLRRKLHGNREALDRQLLAMQQAGRLVLYRLDNPAEITADDDHAALLIAGQPRHLVYLEA